MAARFHRKVTTLVPLLALITCTFVAIFSYIANRLLHIPGALTLAAIASVCDLIPVVGFISSLSIAVLVGFTVSPITALEIGLLYIVYSVIENYLIVPKVYGQTMKLSRLVVLISILIGGQLAGIFGMILILPLVGSWRAIEKYWIEPCISKG